MPRPIDHWQIKNKFNGTRSNLKSRTNGGNRSIFCHVERGRMYYGVRELEFITSRRERARDRIVDRKEFSGQLFMIHALMAAMLFPPALRFHTANTICVYYHEILPAHVVTLIYDLK